MDKPIDRGKQIWYMNMFLSGLKNCVNYCKAENGLHRIPTDVQTPSAQWIYTQCTQNTYAILITDRFRLDGFNFLAISLSVRSHD